MARIYAAEVGPQVVLETGLDLSAASSVAIKAYDPDGELFTLAATVTDTTKLKHTKTAITLNEAGAWTLHSYAEFAGGVVYWGDPYSLRIY